MRPKGPESDTWGALQNRYISYRKLPVWGRLREIPDERGILSPGDLEHVKKLGKDAAARVKKAVHRLKHKDEEFPRRPSGFHQEDIDRIRARRFVPLQELKNFWEAFVLARDNYTCQYCGRRTSRVWRESGGRRTIALVVDHVIPRAKGGLRFTFQNARTACWTCNIIKANLPEPLFLEELRSLCKAVVGRN